MNLGLTRPPNPWRPGNVVPAPLGGWGGMTQLVAARGCGGGGRGRGVFCCGRRRARVVTGAGCWRLAGPASLPHPSPAPLCTFLAPCTRWARPVSH